MKLTDFLQDVGRPVAYYPQLRKITGSVTATILLCQFIYWRGKESSQDGWLYKTADDIQEETGLSYSEQKTARRDLVQAGLIEEYYARLDHQMRFKVDLDAINEKWGNEETHIPESDKPQFGNDENVLSLNESEITTETTTIGDKSPTPIQDMPLDWQISHDQPVTLPDQTEAKMRDAATTLDIGCAGAGALGLAFMTARKMIIPDAKIKGNRKAAREMLEMGVKPEHITEAVTALTEKKMTVTDLFSVSKTAIDIANKPVIYERNKEFGL